MKKVLVTGSRGFVGRHLVSALRHQGCLVCEYDSILGHNVCDPSSLHVFDKEDVDAVIHLAGLTFVPRSWTEPHTFYVTNTLGVQGVLEFCRRNGCRLVNVSAYVYGVPEYLPIDERHPVKPNNPYAHSKYLGERICEFYRDHHGVSVLTVRPFNLYGPGQDGRFLIPLISEQVKAGGSVKVLDLQPRRDYLHVRDFVDLCIQGLDYEGAVPLMNAGSGISYSVRDVLDVFERVVGRSLCIEEVGVERVNEIRETVASSVLAANELLWKPRVRFEDGVREILESVDVKIRGA